MARLAIINVARARARAKTRQLCGHPCATAYTILLTTPCATDVTVHCASEEKPGRASDETQSKKRNMMTRPKYIGQTAEPRSQLTFLFASLCISRSLCEPDRRMAAGWGARVESAGSSGSLGGGLYGTRQRARTTGNALVRARAR